MADQRSEAEKRKQTTWNIVAMATAVFVTALTLTGTFAVMNGLFTGGPIVRSTIDYFLGGIPNVVEGPLRGLLVLGLLMIPSLGVEIAGTKTTAPFWLGLFLMLLILAEFVLPSWITGPFAFLHLGEIFLGVSLGEMNVARTVVLGMVFIFLYYAVLIRIQGARETASAAGSKKLSGVVKLTKSRIINDLVRKYQKVAIAMVGLIATAGAMSVTGIGKALGEGVGIIFGFFMDAPVWGGYLSTLGAWYVDNVMGALPFALSPTEFAAFAVVVLIVTAGAYFS